MGLRCRATVLEQVEIVENSKDVSVDPDGDRILLTSESVNCGVSECNIVWVVMGVDADVLLSIIDRLLDSVS